MDLVNSAGQFLYRVLVGITVVVSTGAVIAIMCGCLWALITYATWVVMPALAVVFAYVVGDFFLYTRE